MTDAAEKHWYIVHTYSGFEKKVSDSLKQRAQAYGLQDAIGEVVIPTEKVHEKRGTKQIEASRRVFPGYIFVQMAMTDEAWHVVKNTPKVTGFVGAGVKPTPMSGDEVKTILEQAERGSLSPVGPSVEKGDQVQINEGPFTSFNGVVEEVNTEKRTLKVMVTIFGRATPVELDFSAVEKL
ncbi:MAG: transcription termination/antitermination factor NusG [Acidobacteria bacterium]|nr:transcription termination/antitermination factor NusG [Acidobacteriota bacterium]